MTFKKTPDQGSGDTCPSHPKTLQKPRFGPLRPLKTKVWGPKALQPLFFNGFWRPPAPRRSPSLEILGAESWEVGKLEKKHRPFDGT